MGIDVSDGSIFVIEKLDHDLGRSENSPGLYHRHGMRGAPRMGNCGAVPDENFSILKRPLMPHDHYRGFGVYLEGNPISNFW